MAYMYVFTCLIIFFRFVTRSDGSSVSSFANCDGVIVPGGSAFLAKSSVMELSTSLETVKKQQQKQGFRNLVR